MKMQQNKENSPIFRRITNTALMLGALALPSIALAGQDQLQAEPEGPPPATEKFRNPVLETQAIFDKAYEVTSDKQAASILTATIVKQSALEAKILSTYERVYKLQGSLNKNEAALLTAAIFDGDLKEADIEAKLKYFTDADFYKAESVMLIYAIATIDINRTITDGFVTALEVTGDRDTAVFLSITASVTNTELGDVLKAYERFKEAGLPADEAALVVAAYGEKAIPFSHVNAHAVAKKIEDYSSRFTNKYIATAAYALSILADKDLDTVAADYEEMREKDGLYRREALTLTAASYDISALPSYYFYEQNTGGSGAGMLPALLILYFVFFANASRSSRY